MESDTTYSFRLKDSLLGAQMLFVAFGALVLVPILTGMSTNVALFTAGVGTLIDVDVIDAVRQAVLVDMAFNLGIHGLGTFNTFLSCMASKQWAAAAADLRGTLVYSQLPVRYERLAVMLETGQWPS